MKAGKQDVEMGQRPRETLKKQFPPASLMMREVFTHTHTHTHTYIPFHLTGILTVEVFWRGGGRTSAGAPAPCPAPGVTG